MARRARTPDDANASPATHLAVAGQGDAAFAAVSGMIETAAERDYNERQQLLVAEFGEGLPWSPSHYEAEIRGELRRGCEAFLRAGRLLLVARGCAAHGEWGGMLERLGIEPRQAQRMMEAARRIGALANASRATHLIEAAGTQSKLIELLALPDDQLQELVTEGETGGLVVDEIDGMTREELRRAIRDARETLAAKDERAAEREQRIDKLQTDLRKAKRELAQAEPDQVEEQLRTALGKASLNARAQIGASGEGVASVANAVRELLAHGEETGADHRDYVAGLLQELITEVRVIRDEHGLPILDQE